MGDELTTTPIPCLPVPLEEEIELGNREGWGGKVCF